MDQLWLLLGRLHPVVVHLPIGIFVLLALVELTALFPRAPRIPSAQRTFVLSIGALFAVATAFFGWLLARDGGYNATLLDRHQWLGIGVAALAVVLLVVHLLGWRRTYAGALTLTVLVLAVAGHFGGSLTHGENYLTATAGAARPKPPTDPARALVFADVVHPILNQRCVSCHGPTKSNGDLRYDTLEELLKGGKTGPAFKPGNAAASAMIKRVHLPLDAKQHMPPKGKPQLTDDEATLLEWWINAGATTDKRVADLAPPPLITELIAAQLGIPPAPLPDRATMLAAAEAIERKLDIIVRPLSADGPWLAANARLQLDKFGDGQLQELAPIAPALYWLDLGETAVSDAGLNSLAAMKNLRRLQLDRTAVTDAGLTHLAPLGHLESLNLHATTITDTGLKTLHALPRLRSLYLWQTKATPAGLERLAKAQTDHNKISRWKSQIAALEANIRAEHFRADLGSRLHPVPAANEAEAAMPPVATPATSKPDAIKPAQPALTGDV
ncbi:MAG: c-type cytochrome domain-containing protein, partial [Opitutaceae bacterium]